MKKIITLLLSLMLVFALTACSAKPEDQPAPTEPAETEQTAAEPTAEPAETEPTEAPTEPATEETPAPAEDDVKLDENDYRVLRDFFEQKDENGVTNGAKCFPNYDPDDVDTWYDGSDNYDNYVSWNNRGNVVLINLAGKADAPVRLCGRLTLSGLSALDRFAANYVVFEELDASDLPTAGAGLDGMISIPMVNGEAVLTGGYIDRIFIGSATHLVCDITGEAETILTGDLPSFRIELTVEGEGWARVAAVSDENYYVVKLTAEAMEGRDFVGWYDAAGKLVSTDAELELFGEQTGLNADGAHAEFVYYARFN